MKVKEEDKQNFKLLDQILRSVEELNEADLMNYVDWYLKRKMDEKMAIKELRLKIVNLSRTVESFCSFYDNQFYFPSLTTQKQLEEDYYTAESLAKKFNICLKTIGNWEKAGLKINRPSPRVLIISRADLYSFFNGNKQKVIG